MKLSEEAEGILTIGAVTVLFVLTTFAFFWAFMPSEAQVKAVNAVTLSEDGELIGTLKDGRVLRCYQIMRQGYTHYVYVVDNVTTVNRTVQQAKNQYVTLVQATIEDN